MVIMFKIIQVAAIVALGIFIYTQYDGGPIFSEFGLWFSKIDINIKIIICAAVFILAALFFPKSDNRFKTGFVGNIIPGGFRGCIIPLIMVISFLFGVYYLIQRMISNIPLEGSRRIRRCQVLPGLVARFYLGLEWVDK